LLSPSYCFFIFFLLAESDIFGEALSDSDEEVGNINIMDMDDDMSNDNSCLSDTNSLMVNFSIKLLLQLGIEEVTV